MDFPTAPQVELQGVPVGILAGAALFALAMAILLWPMVRKLAEARRQRVRETRIALGLGERKG
jgi:hypothetical protein